MLRLTSANLYDATDVVHGEAALSRKRRHAEPDELTAEDRIVLDELKMETTRRSRRSTVMLALTMAMKRCQHVRHLCDVEYQEGNKKVRLRIADE